MDCSVVHLRALGSQGDPVSGLALPLTAGLVIIDS